MISLLASGGPEGVRLMVGLSHDDLRAMRSRPFTISLEDLIRRAEAHGDRTDMREAKLTDFTIDFFVGKDDATMASYIDRAGLGKGDLAEQTKRARARGEDAAILVQDLDNPENV